MINESRKNEYLKIRNKLNCINDNLNKIDLQSFNKQSDTNKYMKLIKEEIKIISKSIEELNSPFLLFIIGPGKYGKTTLINSLIQYKLLDVTDIPNTWKLDVIEKSKEETIEIFQDNKSLILPYKKAIEVLEKEELKYKKSKEIIKSKFNEYKNSDKKSIEELKIYKEKLESSILYKSNIEEVKYNINKNGILNDFIIVDTPGINQTLKSNTNERMFDYYKRADGVLWILDAQNIVSKCSNDLLKELKEEYIIDTDFNNIICVINKIDIIKDKDKLDKIISKTNELYSSYFKDIIFISSKEAITGYENKNEDLIQSSNINNLIRSIDINFKNYSERNQINAKYNSLKILSKNVNRYLDEYKRQLYNDLNKYEESKRILQEEIDKVKEYTAINIRKCLCIERIKEKDIQEDLKLLEANINNEITKLIEKLKEISNIDEKYNVKIEFKNINIVKSKYVLELAKQIKHLQDTKTQNIKFMYKEFLSNYKINDKNWNLRFTLDKFIKNILENIDDILIEIKIEIDSIRENSFRDKYTDYNLIQQHIHFINDISRDIKLWR